MAKRTYPTVMSAADEVAVDAFLHGRIQYIDIAETVERTLAAHAPWPLSDFAAVAEADTWARQAADGVIALLRERR